MDSWRGASIPELPGQGPETYVTDTATGQLAQAAAGPTATMYACGITPYDATHLGHAATFVAWDLLVRAWREYADRAGRPPAVLASKVVWTDGRDHPMNTPRRKPGADRTEIAQAERVGAIPIRSASFVSIMCDAEVVREYARLLAVRMERELPGLVVSRMTRSLRPGRVLLDWSQNHPAKTTVTPYSLRGGHRPYVAAPRDWSELEAAVLTQLDHHQVLERLGSADDPLAPLHRPGPQLPG